MLMIPTPSGNVAAQQLGTTASPTFAGLTISTASIAAKITLQRTTDADTYWLNQINAAGDIFWYFKKPIASGTLTQALAISTDLNFGFGGTGGYGTGSKNVLAIQSNTPPSTSAADRALVYAADISAGNCALHVRTEGGQVIKLYQQAHIGDPSGGSTIDTQARAAINSILAALENNGLLAAA